MVDGAMAGGRGEEVEGEGQRLSDAVAEDFQDQVNG